ncbi:L,D-transpeptidase family protein [Geobacter sp. SVR]|uniref:L,D-transpeptidase family protein n=1 Tax=Geobacter sp. SVR TaxID=2495594 RepID=UPI001565B30A|nr:L,D-transpeptidase family protein [Geobacter sp. SVR]
MASLWCCRNYGWLSSVCRLLLIICCGGCLSGHCPAPAGAAQYSYATGFSGKIRDYTIQMGESLFEIARRFDLGINSIHRANPGADLFIPAAGTRIILPTAWILPDVPEYEGIVINLPELRLYLFSRDDYRSFATFPLGVGDLGYNTPVGAFTIIEKITAPAWYVPASIRREDPSLPAVVPPGPDNPLGSHALRLSLPSVLIHGTNSPWGIGMRSSHGCLRLYPEDILQLYRLVRPGTRVTIVQQAVKASMRGGRVFIQVHQYDGVDYLREARRVLTGRDLFWRVDSSKLKLALQERSGLPVDITR